MDSFSECELDWLLESIHFEARSGCKCDICEHVRSGNKEPYFSIDIEEDK